MRGFLSFDYETFEDGESITIDTIDIFASKIHDITFNYYVIDDSGKIVYQGVVNKIEEKQS